MGLRFKLTQALCEGVLLIGTSTLVLAQESDITKATQSTQTMQNPQAIQATQGKSAQAIQAAQSLSNSSGSTRVESEPYSSNFNQPTQVSKKLLHHPVELEPDAESQRIVLNIEYTKCREILERPSALPFIIAWTDGYLSGVTRNTLTDEEYIRDLSKGIVSYCQQHPNALYWKYVKTYYNVSGTRQ